MWTFLFLILPGLIAFYFLVVRHILRGIPILKQFYNDADSFWDKVWALCGKSLTIAWSYAITVLGIAIQFIDPIASALGDPQLRQQITDGLQANPKILADFLIFVSIVTIAARLRSIIKDAA